MAITPTGFQMAANQSFTLTVTGAGALGVTWSASPALGTLRGLTLTTATYTAPASITSKQNVTITATSISLPITSATAVFTLLPPAISVSPSGATLAPGARQTFSVSGIAANAVTWSASQGAITSAGVYTAPQVGVNTTVTVTATSQANSSLKASVSVRIVSAPGLTFSTYGNGLKTLTFNGINYNYLYGENLVTNVNTVTANGTAYTNPTGCTGTFNATTVTQHCATTGIDSVDVSVTFSTPAAAPGTTTAAGANYATIQADIQFTNNSATDTISQAMLSILGVSMAQYNAAASSAMGISTTTAISYVNYGIGQFMIWANTVSPSIGLNQSCAWSYVCKNQPLLNNVAPGQTVTASFSLRFTDDTTAIPVNLAPEAFTAYRAAYPSVVNWPDRRPIMNWFIADTGHQSATNPRGYLWNPAIDVSNIPNFQAQVMAQAQSILTQIQARPIQPQGVIIWDLEGEEFIQPTTYIGDPRVFGEGYAPEMDATADGLFALFQNAGLKVGITLRPQYMQWGVTAPAQCNYDPSNNYKDYFINVAAPFQQKFFACYDPAGLVWSLIPNGNGGQTFYTQSDPTDVTALLISKVAYAHARWGTTLYYVDTAVSVGGAPLDQSVFRALQTAFPDCLFMPEQSYFATMGSTMPYSDPNVSSDPKFGPVSFRYFYPTSADVVYMDNCQGSCWNANVANFEIGQKIGDIALYSVPTQTGPAQFTQIESMITTARTAAGKMVVTDSSTGTQYAFQGYPATVYQYPLKMRVYFADTATNMPASTTYCESGGWLGTGTCSLNLAGLLLAQIQYWDFNNNLIMTEPVQPR